MSRLNLNQGQQAQLNSWFAQEHPGYTINFQDGTIVGPSPLNERQLEQINNYVSKTFGVNGQLTMSTQSGQSTGV